MKYLGGGCHSPSKTHVIRCGHCSTYMLCNLMMQCAETTVSLICDLPLSLLDHMLLVWECTFFFMTLCLMFYAIRVLKCCSLALLGCAFSVIQYYRCYMCPVLNKKEWSCHAPQRGSPDQQFPTRPHNKRPSTSWVQLFFKKKKKKKTFKLFLQTLY